MEANPMVVVKGLQLVTGYCAMFMLNYDSFYFYTRMRLEKVNGLKGLRIQRLKEFK